MAWTVRVTAIGSGLETRLGERGCVLSHAAHGGRGGGDRGVDVVASSWVGGDVREDVVVLVGSDREGLGGEREEVVKASGEVAFEAAQGTFGGFAFGLFARKVFAGGGVVLGAGDRMMCSAG